MWTITQLLKASCRDFLDSPVVKTLCFHCRGRSAAKKKKKKRQEELNVEGRAPRITHRWITRMPGTSQLPSNISGETKAKFCEGSWWQSQHHWLHTCYAADTIILIHNTWLSQIAKDANAIIFIILLLSTFYRWYNGGTVGLNNLTRPIANKGQNWAPGRYG